MNLMISRYNKETVERRFPSSTDTSLQNTVASFAELVHTNEWVIISTEKNQITDPLYLVFLSPTHENRHVIPDLSSIHYHIILKFHKSPFPQLRFWFLTKSFHVTIHCAYINPDRELTHDFLTTPLCPNILLRTIFPTSINVFPHGSLKFPPWNPSIKKWYSSTFKDVIDHPFFHDEQIVEKKTILYHLLFWFTLVPWNSRELFFNKITSSFNFSVSYKKQDDVIIISIVKIWISQNTMSLLTIIMSKYDI